MAEVLTQLAPSHWQASLALRLGCGARGTRLVSKAHHGPLYVQRPFYPEGPDLAHVYLLHPPGGLVSGDELRYEITLQEESRGLFTTPGAGRVYRARSDHSPQVQRVLLRVEQGASAEWLPMENIVFPGAVASFTTRVELAADSCFIGWEINCIGLPASEAPFARGRLHQCFQLYREGQPLLLEALNLDTADERLFRSRVGLGGYCVSGLLVATLNGDIAEADAEALVGELRALCHAGPRELAVTRIGELLLLRYLGSCTHRARTLFEAGWQCLRPLVLGRSACPPGIWST